MNLSHKEKARAKRLRDNFDLTIEEDDKLSSFQQDVCYICGKKQKSGKRLATEEYYVSFWLNDTFYLYPHAFKI